jgi:hypothetical protein
MKVGDKVVINYPSASVYHGTNATVTGIDKYGNCIIKLFDGREDRIYPDYLIHFEDPPASPPVHGWEDQVDKSIYKNIRPGVHATCMYAHDGSCWEWAVGGGPPSLYGGGRSVDRRTAKSDAEFFINNYQPEDTTERDEIRRKLERNWSGV